jgi:alpha-N-arabinofuranosidase
VKKARPKFWLVSFLSIIVLNSFAGAADKSEIIIDCSTTKVVNPSIFGHNSLAFRYPSSKNWKPKDYSIYGAGQWNTSRSKPNIELVKLAKEIKMSVLRFPGGGGAHRYKWKDAIGPLKDRPFFKFGLDEFMELCEATGAEPMITMNYLTSTDDELADMVEYLNAPDDGSNLTGGTSYAGQRAANGHPAPYNVKYFELGNEVYYPDIRPIGKVTAEEYAARYLKIRSHLRSINKNIKLGAVLNTSSWGWTNWKNETWNIDVVSLIGSSLDFAIVHPYACAYRSEIGELSATELFSIALAAPPQIASRLAIYSNNLEALTGKVVPLAITEYNGGMVQNKPVPYRHSLGNALVIADMLQSFLTADIPILCANYWHFSNSYWGAIYNHDYREGNGKYYFRPNYFVFEMFSKNFGELIAESTVFCPSYTSRSYRDVYKTMDNAGNTYTDRSDVISHVINPEDWIVREKPGVKVSKISNEIRISFDNYNKRNYYHTKALQRVKPDHSYQLTALIKTENLETSATAHLEVQDFRGWSKIKWAKRTKGVPGTRDWTKVFINFDPVDANSKGVNILIREYSKKGPVRGIIRVKNVILKDIGPTKQYPSTPYLSAIASINRKRNKLYLIVVNKNLTDHMPSIIRIKNFNLLPEIKIRMLNGKSVDATNENGNTEVTVSSESFSIRPGSECFKFSFEPHSVTALEMSKNS